MTGLFTKPPPEPDADPVRLNGTVLLTFEDPLPTEVPALLTAWEETGFQARHHCFVFRSGQIVAFQCVASEGRAQIVSTEIRDGYAETRFSILDSSD